jgi:hypothetical protein
MSVFTRAGMAMSVVVLASGLLSTPPADAANPCGTPGVGYTGAQTAFKPSVYGARASIEYQNTDLCGSDATGFGLAEMWAMTAAYSVDSATNRNMMGYAQSGYIQAGGAVPGYATGIWRWGQYSSRCTSHANCGSAAPFHNLYAGHPDGAKEMYAAYRSASDGHVHMTVGSTSIGETNYDPTGDWSSNWQGQFYGEVHDWNTDVPGTVGNKATMNYLQKYDSTGGIDFFAVVTGSTTAGTRYHRDVYDSSVGGQGVNIWTNPL